MRVLVTGGTGFVGSHAVAALHEAGHECVLLARNPEKARKITSKVLQGDIRDAHAVRQALATCDAVLHAAADMGVTGRGADLHGANVVGLENVLGQAVELGLAPVVNLSTVAVFVPPASPTITVDSPLGSPRNAYGRSKLTGELYARSLPGVTIVYPGGVAGPGQPTLDALNEGIRAGVRQGWPIVPGGVCVIDVRDLAVALAGCFEDDGPRRLMFAGAFVKWPEMADLCERATGRKIRRFKLPGSALKAMGGALDRLKRAIPIDYPLTRDAADLMLTMVPVENDKRLRLRPTLDTISDTLRWLADQGHLKPAEIGRLGP